MRPRVSFLFLLGALSVAAVPARATAQSRTGQAAVLPGPRVAAPPPKVEFRLPGESAKDNTKMRGSHTITISTLSLVLAVILLVVLID